MKLKLVCVIGFLAATAAFAQDDAARAKLAGAWQGQDQNVWTFQDQGDGMHITNSQGDKKIEEFACDLGKECQVKDAGRKVKVTMYFNGPMLVVLETRGDDVMKRRFSVAETGTSLQVENIPVTPSGKTETAHFTRVDATAASKTGPPKS